ncbi:MAG: flavodoxin family protein [Lachnospiraceae bacterium]|jgi:multimeric flavodoxin WrbA|nr:flavodoxin family protein [Lachnospiraceae bacterium]
MKVLLVNGSPHENGCTGTALKEVAQSLEKESIETKIFWIGNKPIGGCIGCRACEKKKECAFDGDKVNEFLQIAGSYDGFVFGTPVHFASAAGNMSSFMDRVFSADMNGGGSRFLLKPAAAVVSARRAGTTVTWDQLNKYFGICQMPVISSRYWNMVHGSTPEQVMEDREGVQVMHILGKNMAYFLKCKEAGEKAGIKAPEQEQVTFTNFIR